ncbi:hypothetical protein RHSIM_Rhsim02G0153100 [Rhododendron simsii]|uniref:Uncharacterized protein n=1 Tax=Rhododendron simsii TaxID=118357 RepID=A0A834LZ56_RHOSS|nr:hypothetical protein RHSIM_Rhsim02G0153100 [Rhododendron simsii]
MDFTSKTIEYLRRDQGDVLDKSGPKVARHPSIYDSLTSTQRSPYIPPDNIDDFIYNGARKCSEIDGRGFSKDRGSSHISLLRPFSRSEVDDSIPGSNFNLLIKKMKNEGVGWDSSFNIRGSSSHLQESIWLFCWLSGFVLPHSSNEVRSSTFVMASKMTRGLLCSLAIPVLAYLYHCFNKVANTSIPGKKAVYGPFQYSLDGYPFIFQRLILMAIRQMRDLLQEDILKILESKCRQFCGTPVHFEVENPEALTLILSDGKDSILEGKDVPAVLNIFEKGRELLVLGRVKASIEAHSLPLSSEYSASASNLSRGQSKHDSQGETNDEDNESEDETDELYNYTPLSDCSPKSAFKGITSCLHTESFLLILFAHLCFTFFPSHPSSHSTISTAPIESPKPIGSLPSKSATSFAAMATFKDHASPKNSWQATPSKSLPSLTPQVQSTGEASFDDLMDPVELEGLIARIEKPPVQSIPLSSNEAAVHIQKGLFISLQSPTISTEDIITQSNGIISILKSFKVDLSSLYEKVKALVKYSVLWTKVSSTSDKDVALRELEAQYEVKKTNFDEMASSYEEMASSVSKLSERVTSLEEEIAPTKELLKKLESELSSCNAKHSSSQSDLTKYSETISKSEEDLHVALDIVDQCKKKSAHYDAVKEALDAARASLMN